MATGPINEIGIGPPAISSQPTSYALPGPDLSSLELSALPIPPLLPPPPKAEARAGENGETHPHTPSPRLLAAPMAAGGRRTLETGGGPAPSDQGESLRSRESSDRGASSWARTAHHLFDELRGKSGKNTGMWEGPSLLVSNK